MPKKTGYLLISLLLVLTLGIITSCGVEEYQMDTDEEFQQAVEEAIEGVFRGEETVGNITEQLYGQYSDRYSESEIQEYVEAKLGEEEEKLNSRIDEIEQETIELENQVMDYLDELRDLVDEPTMREVEAEIGPISDRIEELSVELHATPDFYHKIDLMEEKKEYHEDMLSILENALQAAQENGIDEEPLEEEPVEEEEEPAEEAVEEDFTSYRQEMEQLVEEETAIIDSYRRVAGDEDADVQSVLAELVETTLPLTESYLDNLRNVETETPQLQEIHEIYIEGWETRLAGFEHLVEGLEEQDEQVMEQANQFLQEATQLLEQYNQELDQLAQEYDIGVD